MSRRCSIKVLTGSQRRSVKRAAEVIIAAKNRDRAQVAHEVADLWFHTLVLLAEQGMTPADVTAVLAERRGGGTSPAGPPMVSG